MSLSVHIVILHAAKWQHLSVHTQAKVKLYLVNIIPKKDVKQNYNYFGACKPPQETCINRT